MGQMANAVPSAAMGLIVSGVCTGAWVKWLGSNGLGQMASGECTGAIHGSNDQW